MPVDPALSRQDVEKHLQYGAVAFDNGQAGPGWMSISGGNPYRISGPSELSTSILLLSNLTYEQMRESGLLVNPWIKGTDFIKMPWKSLLDDIGLSDDPENLPTAVRTSASMFHRVMMIASEAGLNYRDASADSLPKDLEKIWPEPELPVGNWKSHQEATRHCLQERTLCTTAFVKNGVMVTLRLPRIQHARTILTSGIPVGPWMPFRKAAAPEGTDFLDWLLSTGKPFIARIELPTGLADEAAPIISFGAGSRDDGGNGLRRQWATDLEIREIMKYGRVMIKTAIVARDSVQLELPEFIGQMLKSGPALMSNSVGIFMENLWLSLVLRRRNPDAGPTTKQLDRFIISYRAAYLRSLDRMICMKYALKLSEKWTVKSYGVGSISVSVDESEINDLLIDAFALGLEPAVGMSVRHNASLPATAVWGGPPPFELAARLKANGKDAAFRKLDDIYFLAPSERQKTLVDIQRLAA